MLEELKKSVSNVQVNVALAPLTTYRLGGAAEFFVEAKTAAEAIAAARAARQLGLPILFLGGGSNILVNDEGVQGLVIRLNNRDIKIDGEQMIVGAGAPASLVALRSVEAGLAGFEWASGLPGTIGGAVRGNAGTGREMKDSVIAVRAFDGETERILTNAECQFTYRDSVFKRQSNWVVLEVTLQLSRTTDSNKSRELSQTIVKDRQAKQPLENFSAGCVFKNWRPENAEQQESLRRSLDLNKEEIIPLTAQGTIPAGWIIDRAGLKGYRVGHAWVSEKHGNFLVHDGQGTTSEIIALIAAVKMKVRDMTRGIVNFEEEIQYVGF